MAAFINACSFTVKAGIRYGARVPRPRKHADEHLVAAAARAIGARGPHALTLADVAAEAGVAPATLVQRFGSKRGLLLAVAASGPESVAGAFAAARERRASPLRALEDVLVAFASRVADPDEVAHHLAFLALDLSDPEFRAHAARHADALRREVGRLLDEAAAAGELALRRRGPLAEALVSAYNGALLGWSIDRRGSAPERVREHVRLLLRPYRAGAAA
jgi:AcrR family transcriptional regulator